MKKILALVFASLMVLGIAGSAYAAANSSAEITGLTQNLSVGYSGDSDLGEISPQDERVEYIELTDDMFSWDGDYVPAATPATLSSSQIRKAKLTVRASNNKVLEDVSINSGKSRIEVKFLEKVAGTKEIDFDFDVVLSVDGHRQSDYAMNFSGTLANPVYEVYAGAEYEDISHGEVAEAQEYIRSIRLDVGSGVSIVTKMMKDSRIYATATFTPDRSDEEVFEKYRSIRDVINLSTVGVPSSATVELGEEYRDYYVYSEKGEYLGLGKDSFSVIDKYYLSHEAADDFVSDHSPKEENSNLPEPQPAYNEPLVSGSGEPVVSSYPVNIFDNPNTGR
jgi:hypothetical protein